MTIKVVIGIILIIASFIYIIKHPSQSLMQGLFENSEKRYEEEKAKEAEATALAEAQETENPAEIADSGKEV